MNISATMEALYVACAEFDQLADELEKKGCPRTAHELRRESSRLGGRVLSMDALLDDLNIVELQQQHKAPPRFIGVDMGSPGSDRTCFNEVKR